MLSIETGLFCNKFSPQIFVEPKLLNSLSSIVSSIQITSAALAWEVDNEGNTED